MLMRHDLKNLDNSSILAAHHNRTEKFAPNQLKQIATSPTAVNHEVDMSSTL